MKWHDERGSALLLTVVVVVVLLFLAGSLGVIAMVESRMAQREAQAMQAYYLARSGADAMAQAIINDPAILKEDILNRTSIPSSLQGGLGEFSVKVVPEGGGFLIESTGVVGDIERVVSLVLIQGAIGSPFEHAVFTIGTPSNPDIKVDGSAKISGPVGTKSDDVNSVVVVGGGSITGEREFSSKLQYPQPNFPDFPGDLPSRPDFKMEWKKDLDYRITEDGYYQKITTSSGWTLKIDLQGGVRKLRVRQFTIAGPIELINVGEKGRLILYIDEGFSMGGNYNINYTSDGSNNPETLTIYYAGGQTFGNAQFNLCGNVVVKDAPIKLGNGSKFHGSIFSQSSKDVTIDGAAIAANGIVYAPKAKVTVTGSAQTGTIIASSMVVSGNSRVTFAGGPDLDSFPEGVLGTSFGQEGKHRYSRGLWSAMR